MRELPPGVVHECTFDRLLGFDLPCAFCHEGKAYQLAFDDGVGGTIEVILKQGFLTFRRDGRKTVVGVWTVEKEPR